MKTLNHFFVSVASLSLIFSACSKQSELSKVSAAEKQTATITPLATNADKVVIGYIPGWANVQTVTDAVDFDIVTHVNLAFFAASPAGAVMSNGQPLFSDFNASEINYVVSKAHAKGRKVLASLGGGNPDENAADMSVLFRAANRTAFIENLAAFVTYFNLDGIDVDVEGSTLTKIKNEQNYAPFIAALRAKINPQGKLVTAATAGYDDGMIPSSSYAYLDLINIMSYDNGWGGTANHSTYDAAVAHIQKFLNSGAPASKLVLGLPFYGYKPTVGTGEKSFKELLAQYGSAVAYVDYYDGYKYNGITAIEAKTKYAAQYIKGVMIWELSMDVQGTYSLLQAVGRKINTPAP
jgi:chitinase